MLPSFLNEMLNMIYGSFYLDSIESVESLLMVQFISYRWLKPTAIEELLTSPGNG